MSTAGLSAGTLAVVACATQKHHAGSNSEKTDQKTDAKPASPDYCYVVEVKCDYYSPFVKHI